MIRMYEETINSLEPSNKTEELIKETIESNFQGFLESNSIWTKTLLLDGIDYLLKTVFNIDMVDVYGETKEKRYIH